MRDKQNNVGSLGIPLVTEVLKDLMRYQGVTNVCVFLP